MIVTIFRSRLRAGVSEDYAPTADRMDELAATMQGYVSHKGFLAEDGERVTIVEFESEEALAAWRMHPEHLAAQRAGREMFYEEFHLQTCEVLRQSNFRRKEAAA
jgi:heme-degrading monooxygenase HmoA